MVGPRAIGIAMVVLAVSACVSFNDVQCADGHLCPPGSRCDDVNGGCILPSQLQACSGIADGAECDVDGARGTCVDGACVPWTCGDGARNGGEACDQTASGPDFGGMTCIDFGFRNEQGLECTSDCRINKDFCTGGCGDKAMDSTEQCDGEVPPNVTCQTLDFYEAPGLKCSAFCTYDVSECKGFCGDGTPNGPEQCDAVPPAGDSCLDYSFDAGRLGCSLCAPGFEGCTSFGWRNVPTLTARRLTGIWGASSTNFYVTGQVGTLLHYDGTSVVPVSTPVSTDLHGVWGSGADVFVVGANDTILHSNGGGFTKMTVPTTGALYAVWGTAANDVYAVGDGGTMLHYDGTWTTVAAGAGANDLRAIWGSGANDIFAVGANGMVAHYTGSWSASSIGAYELSAVWGSGSNVFVAGSDSSNNAIVLRYNGGTSWTPVYNGTFGIVRAGWGAGANDGFAVGTELLHFDGTKWTQLSSPSEVVGGVRVQAIWGSPTGDVWAVGDNGYLARWGGASWTAAISGTGDTLRSVSALGPSDAIAVGFTFGGQNTSRRYNGTTWSALTTPNSTDGLYSVWYGSSTFAIAVGDESTTSGVIYRLNGSSWTKLATNDAQNCSASPALPSPILRGVWGANTSNVFAVGGGATGVVKQFNGTCWSTPATQPSATSFLFGVTGVGSTVLANTSSPAASFSFNGSTWSTLPALPAPTPASIGGMWASSSTDVFAVGDAILHYNGATWQRMSANGQGLAAVSGTGPRNVFAVGNNSKLLHYDGVSWTPIKVPVPQASTFLRGVAATSRSVIVVGDGGFVQRLSFSLRPSEVNCRDAWDDDGDGNPDCADADCATDISCTSGGTCAVIKDVKCGDTIEGTTLGRTPGRDFYSCASDAEAGPEAIYRLVPAADGSATATLSGFASANLDLVVVGSMPATDACDPDINCDGASATANASEAVTVPTVAGRPEYIIVEGRAGADAGPFTLTVTCQ